MIPRFKLTLFITGINLNKCFVKLILLSEGFDINQRGNNHVFRAFF